MKTLKLNFAPLSLLVIFALAMFVTSCEQAVIEAPVVSEIERTQQLESDPNFLEINELNNQLLNEITSVMQAKGISGEDLKNIYLNEDVDAMINFTEGTEIEAIMARITPIAQQLSINYSDLTTANEDITANLEAGFDQLELITNIESRGCGWRYYVCSGAAWSGLVACTAGTSGYGVYFCYISYSGILALCVDSYC